MICMSKVSKQINTTVQVRLVLEVSKVHNRDSKNLIVYMSEVSKLFL